MRSSSSSIRRISTRARVIMLLGLLIVPAMNGCVRLAPKTTTLKKIHDSYRTDFQQFIQLSVPAPSRDARSQAPKPDEIAFAETLREIRDYRVKYGEKSQEAAHLKVLEGMIYLQSSQFGMARLIAADVSNAQASLKSGTGDFARDQLLALVFSDLVTGWEEINKQNDPTPGHNGGDVGKLITAGDDIKAKLDALDKSKLAQPEVDEGAVYIATNAAIFYVYVFNICSPSGQSPPPPCTLPNTKQQWLGKGRDLIGRYLTETEKSTSQGLQANTQAFPAGRLRYVSWYGFLSHEATQ